MSMPYLICLDCGRLWREIQEIAHQVKADHDPVCPAMLWQRERFRQSLPQRSLEVLEEIRGKR